MNQSHQFKFISTTGKEALVSFDIVYPRILKYLDISIVVKLQYNIDTPISDELFDSFIKFLNLESIPEITVQNVDDYMKLSQELKFRELELLVEKFIREKKESDDIIQNLISTEKGRDSSFLEKLVASHLDFYIENHPDLLSSFNLTTLFNIFNDKQRVLRDETSALRFLINIVENGRHDFAVLFQLIDFEKVDKSLIQTVVNSDFFNDKPVGGLSPKLQNQTIKNFYSFIDETKISQQELELKIMRNLNEMEERLNSKIQESLYNIYSVVNDVQEKFKNKINELSNKVDTIIENYENHEKTINNLSNDLNLIKQIFEMDGIQIDKLKIINNLNFAFNQSLPINQTDKEKKEGIISCLKSMEQGFNDHHFITMLSKRDPYSIIHPNSSDYYCSSNGGDFYVEIEFESSKEIEGVIIKSYNDDNIKGFKIIVDDENEVFTTDGIEELNKKYGEAKIYFDQCKAKKIKLMQVGKNFQNKNFVRIKRFDVITKEAPNGYFKSIINGVDDVYLLPIKLRFNYITTENFYKIDSQKSIGSIFENGTNGFLEILFMKGFAFIEGYRLKRSSNVEQMKGWEILGQQEENGEWIKLDRRTEESLLSYPQCEVFEMKVKTLVKRIRVIQTCKTWDNTCFFRILHFDVFGKYFFNK